MRVAIDARYISREFSGIANLSENMLKTLTPMNPDIEFTVFIHSSFERKLDLPKNVKLVPIPARPVSFYTLFRMGAVVRAARPDIFHTMFPITPFTLNTPTIVAVHDLQPLNVPGFCGRRIFPIRKAYEWFYRWIYPRTIRRARYVVANSHTTRRSIARMIPQAQGSVIVVYPGVDPTFSLPVDEMTAQQTIKRLDLPERFVLYLGSTRPNKNLPNMLRAFDRMRRRHKDVRDLHFVMIVSEDRFFEEARKEIERLSLEDRVRIRPQVSELEKRCLYDQAVALYFVTKYEGFGIPALEAQTCGLPVLAADHGSLPEIGQDSLLLVNPDDVEAIGEKLYRIVVDSDLRADLVRKGQKNVRRFDWEQSVKTISDIYRYLF